MRDIAGVNQGKIVADGSELEIIDIGTGEDGE